MIGALIGAGVGLASAFLNRKSSSEANSVNRELNEKQLALDREQFEYQKSLNQQTMEREDNAYQRAVSDMQQAGLNPLSATGGASASSLSAGSPMSAGKFQMQAPQLDLTSAIQAFTSYDATQTQRQATLLNNATNQAIAEMQQRGIDMANAYNYEVGMANAFANQLQAITNYERSGIKDPEVLKALKDQIIADAKNAENNARGSGTTADLLQQEYEGRSKSGNYRGMPEKVGNIREGEQFIKDKADDLVDIVSDATDDKSGLGKVKSGDNIFAKILSAMNSANRGARKQASRQLLRGARR